MSPPKETRADRVKRLKNKFRYLRGIGLVREYVRYERAKDGTLPHQFPEDYVDEIMEALEQLIREHYNDNGKLILKALDVLRRTESKPFLPPK